MIEKTEVGTASKWESQGSNSNRSPSKAHFSACFIILHFFTLSFLIWLITLKWQWNHSEPGEQRYKEDLK